MSPCSWAHINRNCSNSRRPAAAFGFRRLQNRTSNENYVEEILMVLSKGKKIILILLVILVAVIAVIAGFFAIK